MRRTGLIIITIGLFGFSMVLGMTKLFYYLDQLSGEFYLDWYRYLDFNMIFPICIILVIGIGLIWKGDSNNKEK